MGVLQYLSPRFCSAGGHASEAVEIFGTIAPGCGQAVSMTRPLLHAILDWAGKADPLATLEAFVDDLVLAVVAPTTKRVAATTVTMGRTLWQRLAAIGCVVSRSKSQVVCSSKDMQRALQQRMDGDLWRVQVHMRARDLGVDMGAGRQRTVRILRTRFSKFQKRVARLRRMARASHRARALYHQAQPQATWGQEVMGLSPTMLQALRRSAVRATGLNIVGMSTTATLACVHGWRKDPASTTALSQIVAWVDVWRADPRLRREVQEAWPSILAYLEGTRPWTRAKGPAAALVLMMRSYGWEVVAPDLWIDPRGGRWQPTEQALNMDMFLDDFAQDIEAVLWTKAAVHWQGQGLQNGGPDQWTLQRVLSRARSQDMKAYNLMVKIAGGGCWTKQRCHDQLACKPCPLCPRCREAAETDFHRWWECPANQELKIHDPEAFSTAVSMLAFRYASEFPCWVARGLLPASLTTPPPPADIMEGTFSPSPTGTRKTWTCVQEAFTDGSGGQHSADPRLRRCGWGFVVLAPPPGWTTDAEDDGESGGFIECEDDDDGGKVTVYFAGYGALVGAVQRVGRAELVAVTQLLATTAGPMKVWVDYQAVVDGFTRGPTHTMTSRMADLWVEFWDALEARPGGKAAISIAKVKAHVAEDVARQQGCIRTWHGTRLADIQAGMGADLHQIPANVVKQVKLHTEMADLFLRRMAVILSSVVELDADKVPGPERIPKWKLRRRALTRAILYSGHQLVPRPRTNGGVRLVCTRCLAVRRGGSSLLPWLKHQSCPGVAPAGGRAIAACPLAHSSHVLELHGDVAICRRCGCYAGFGNGIRKLRFPCTGRRAARYAENFRNLGRGRHPHGGPLGDLGLATLFELDCLVV